MARGLALPIMAGGAALILLGGGKKRKLSGRTRWGVKVSTDCQDVTIVDPVLFQKFLIGAFDELVSIDPALGIIQLTDALFGDVAPNCSGFPEEPESAAVAELYATIARMMARLMIEDPRVVAADTDLVDEATQIEFADWYRAWRNYPSSTVMKAPPEEVAFSSDYSKYEIGPKWYEATIIPEAEQAVREGRADSLFEYIVENRGVLVGQFITPMSELPEDKPAVEEFLDKLEDAIERAISEVS